MRLKKVYLLLFLLVPACVFSLRTASAQGPGGKGLQAISITVSGQLLNDSTGKPVRNHGVTVKVPYIGYNKTVYTDTSGNYADTIHDLPGLGDTVWVSTYDCHNILHTQSQPIKSYSIMINFFICETFNPQCIAEFIAELDSSSVTPCKYRFIDLSSGNPDNWLWTFGDGTTSAERNPTHIYAKTGHYKACLTVSRTNVSAPCSDSSCYEIYTPRYYSIGGHVFAGDHPINNPASTGDTGVAYLYRMLNNRVVAFDTLTFTYLGYYSFSHVMEGEYMVKVALTPGSVHAGKFSPAYYSQELYWQQAKLLRVTDTSVFNFDISLISANDSMFGNGRIGGRVERHTQTSGIFTLYRSEVLLLDSQKNLITYTLTDADGNFSFPDIPYGTYLMFVESTGKFSKFTQVVISAQNPYADTLVLDIYDHNTTGISVPGGSENILAGKPFPNPFEGIVSIPLTLARPASLSASVYSLQGILQAERHVEQMQGSHALTIDLAGLKPGVYLLVIKTSEGEVISREKIIKY